MTLGLGRTPPEAVWKREHGRLRAEKAKRMKRLEKESARPIRLLADADLVPEATSSSCNPAGTKVVPSLW